MFIVVFIVFRDGKNKIKLCIYGLVEEWINNGILFGFKRKEILLYVKYGWNSKVLC